MNLYHHILLKVGDLQYASPATVSRAGMVYVDPKNLGYMPFWQRWLSSRCNQVERDTFNVLFNRYVPNALRYIIEGITGSVEGEPLQMAVPQTALNLASFFVIKVLFSEDFSFLCSHLFFISECLGDSTMFHAGCACPSSSP